jgi:tRNA(Ile)-lysidine synthase
LSPQADDWQAFCQDYCQRLGVALTVYRVCVPADSPEGLEAAARRVRYEAFTALEADWLALAHHQGDLAETWLFNLLRGAGLAGLRGMPQVRPLRPGLNLIRPLLQVCRHDIEAYLAARGEAWLRMRAMPRPGLPAIFCAGRCCPCCTSVFRQCRSDWP